MNKPIDVVILWVDDQDKKWMEKKKYWQKKEGVRENQKERYRDWDNLHYLFRGIEKYATWINHIFLVTDNQRPCWLDKNYEKVTIIDHTEIIDNKYLPVFNASAIEVNLHKIEGLSENFIYFNDDMFIIDEVKPTDFFTNNVPRDTGVSNLLAPKRGYIYNVTYNNLVLINENFKKSDAIKAKPSNWINMKYGTDIIKNILLLPWGSFSGFIEPHISISYNKSTFEEVWKKYEDELINTTKSKFRANDNYNQWLMRYWQLASNNFKPREGNFGLNISIVDQESIDKCVDQLLHKKSKVVCINDNELLEDFNTAKTTINQTLETLFPEKSKYEK